MSKKEFKTKVVTVRMSEGMRQQVLEQAAKKHLGIQEYIRYLIIRDAEKLSEHYEQ